MNQTFCRTFSLCQRRFGGIGLPFIFYLQLLEIILYLQLLIILYFQFLEEVFQDF